MHRAGLTTCSARVVQVYSSGRPVMSDAIIKSHRREFLMTTGLLVVGNHGAQGAQAAVLEEEGLDPSLYVPKCQVPHCVDELEISKVIKGCWQLSGGHRGDGSSNRTAGEDAVDDIEKFVSNGITTLDTADIYGPSESLIGKFRLKYPEQAESAQILTKLCCFGGTMLQARQGGLNFVSDRVTSSKTRMAFRNASTPLDCVQFFWEDYGVSGYTDVALCMTELKHRGGIRSIGVTNFDTKRMSQMIDAGVEISLNQVQYSILDTRPEKFMTEFCKQKDIGILAFGTVAGGFLSNKYLGKTPSDVRLNTYSLQKYASIIRERGGWEWYQELLQILDDIAQSKRQPLVGIAEVATRFILEQDGVASVIIGARNANHIQQHKALFSFHLSDDDMNRIRTFLQTGNPPKSDVYEWERGMAQF